ncbi:MAG TPA: hypothetical protein VKK79_20130 [Candidatus Lokiarchaeia archaeon]|nr:hypothetical protein [Candidatus Lokiarchaeia archaeon]
MSETEVDLNDDHKPVTKAMLRSWLEKFGIPADRIFEPTAEEIEQAAVDLQPLMRNMLIVPYKYTIQNAEEDTPPFVFEAKITFLHKWLNVKLMLIQAESVPDRLRLPLYEKLLQANFDLNEVTFSLSPSQDVFVEADMPVESDYLNFESEYGSIEFGVDYFLTELIPDLNEVNVKSTFNIDLYT